MLACSMERMGGKYTIKQIFKDHWWSYLALHPEIPAYVIDNVDKMMRCRDPERMGYVKMACIDHPDKVRVIPHSCKSRFCNACGKVAVDRWLEEACEAFPNVPYAHVTWTVPSELRPLLRAHPEHRTILFQVSSRIVLEWCRKRGWIPAITSVLHTFGRDLKFHPHIHMLVSAGGLDVTDMQRWIDCTYLPEGMLKEQWKTRLLYALYGKHLISHRLKRALYRTKWYLMLAASLMLPVVTTNYVGRYTKRPPLAEARIEGYDGNTVMFSFTDWYLEKQKNWRTVSAEEFMGLLIQHIPPQHGRLINHYGLLHNRVRRKYRTILKERFGAIKVSKPVADWRTRQKEYRGLDPLLCPVCQKEMVVVEVAYWLKKGQRLVVKEIKGA